MDGINTVRLNKLRNFLRHYNFIETRQKGSRLIFTRQGLACPVVVAVHRKEVDFYGCLEIMKILKMSSDEFLKEVKKYVSVLNSMNANKLKKLIYIKRF
jgi:predicted RNA binding protein YcfA (HicA-like mRNA interferase family)